MPAVCPRLLLQVRPPTLALLVVHMVVVEMNILVVEYVVYMYNVYTCKYTVYMYIVVIWLWDVLNFALCMNNVRTMYAYTL